MQVNIDDITMQIIPDECPDTSYLDQPDFEDRQREYRRGDFGFIGVRAAIELQIPHPSGGYHTVQTLHSAGLWGIESDSSDEYLREVFQEERAELAIMLDQIGITLVTN